MWNLYHLKYFLDAARKQSVTESARINRVSASAISQAIRALESQLGTNLLEHRKKDFSLTSAGRSLMEEASEFLDRMEMLKKNVHQNKVLEQGTLRVACSNAVAQIVLPKILIALQKQAPGIHPVLSLANARRTKELILNREIDLALAVHEAPLSLFESTAVLKGNFVLAQAKTATSKEAFEKLKFITGDTGEEINQFHNDFQKKFRTPPKVWTEVQSWMASLALAKEGLAAALVPDFLVKNDSRFKIVPCPFKLSSYQLNIYYRKEEHLSRSAERFLEICKSIS